MRQRLIFGVLVFTLLAGCSITQAMPMLPPAGLNPGDM